MVRLVLPEGTVKLICEVQLLVPDGMIISVVEAVAALKQAATSVELVDAAVSVVPDEVQAAKADEQPNRISETRRVKRFISPQ